MFVKKKFGSFDFKNAKAQKHKNRGPFKQSQESLSPASQHAGATPGRPAREGQAAHRCRAQRWSRRFGGLPVRGTAHHCATPRSARQLLASPPTPGFRARPHPTGRTRWAGHVCSPACIGPARGGPAVVCVLRCSSAVQTRVLGSPYATCSARCAGVLRSSFSGTARVMHARIPGALSCRASWTDRPQTPSISRLFSMPSFSLSPGCVGHSRHRCAVPFALPHTPHGMPALAPCG